jgi:hypothetical protein
LEGLADPQIRRHHVARLENDDIAGHKPVRIDHPRLPVPAHPGLDLRDAHQRFHRPRGTELGEETDGAVEQQHHDDGAAFGDVAQQKGHQRRGCQQPDNDAAELVGEDRKTALGLLAAQLVGPAGLQPLTHFRMAQPCRRIGLQPCGDIGHGKRMRIFKPACCHANLCLRNGCGLLVRRARNATDGQTEPRIPSHQHDRDQVAANRMQLAYGLPFSQVTSWP